MTFKELLIHEIDAMSDLELENALDMIRTLRAITSQQKTVVSQEKKSELIRSLRGKYAHLQTSSELFAQGKQEEIDWEDRNEWLDKFTEQRKNSWQPDFFEDVIGGWEGEKLVRDIQPDDEMREELR